MSRISKMNRVSKMLFTLSVIISMFMTGVNVHADSGLDNEPVNVDFVSVDFDGVIITTEHSEDKVCAEYFETDTEYGYRFIAIESGDTLEKISSDKITSLNTRSAISPRSAGNYLREFRSEIYITYQGRSAVFSSDVILELYHYNNYRQIIGYHDGTLRAKSSGQWTIESPLIVVTASGGKYPTTKVSVVSSGMATIQKGSAINAGFSFEFLKGAGFDISASTSWSTYIRKYIGKSYTISLY